MSRIKICGITREEDALLAQTLGAWGVGFIFVPSSPRFIREEQAKKISSALSGSVKRIGVFVNEDPNKVSAVAKEVSLDFVQLHGDESPDYCSNLGIPFIKALNLDGPSDLSQIPQYSEAFAILLDAAASKDGNRGGTGKTFNWDWVAEAKKLHPRIILSGGLNKDNVTQAYQKTHPWALDMSSGVESQPGIKDAEKLKMVFANFDLPTSRGYFGEFGGSFVPETLVAPIEELAREYERAKVDPEFQKRLAQLLKDYVGRPTALTFAKRLTESCGGAQIWLKREDLAHTGAHKINNTIGQGLLAQRMGKSRLVAETGAGQHGVATATVAALLGLKCRVYMGEVDMKRQEPNVFRMRLLGAEVVSVSSGTKTLKDAISEAMRDWVTQISTTHYCLGSVLGPHPYPMMVRDFQSVIGKEARSQVLDKIGKLPDLLIACVGGGSNAMGLFHAFIGDKEVSMVGVEAGGRSIKHGQHAARFAGGSLGVLQGTRTLVLQNKEGQIEETHSISAGLDYAAIGPEHVYLEKSGRAQYAYATDKEALHAFHLLAELEGIIPALESSHAIAHAVKIAGKMRSDQVILVNLSGRGDKDLSTVRSFS